MRLGVLGATGWLGGAFTRRVLEGGLWAAAGMVLSNRSGPSGAFAPHHPVWVEAASGLNGCEVIVLSVRPEDFPPRGFDPGGALVISFMALWSLERLRAAMPGARLIRAMPNGGAREGTSFTPWLAGAGVTAADRVLASRLLGAMGTEAEIGEEAQLDYLTALSGSGAAYPALMARAMLADAAARGLPRSVAEAAVEAVIVGSGPFLKGRMGEVQAVLEAYHGYGGVTDAGLKAAMAAGFEEAVRAALEAGTRKAGG